MVFVVEGFRCIPEGFRWDEFWCIPEGLSVYSGGISGISELFPPISPPIFTPISEDNPPLAFAFDERCQDIAVELHLVALFFWLFMQHVRSSPL